jgi:nucleotide-binding universal stress UspA family protein
MFDSKKILLPIDFSDRSVAVAPFATSFAKQFQSQLVLLHVEHKPNFFGRIAAHTHPGAASVMEASQVEAELETFCTTQFSGAPVLPHIMQGDPAEAIIECARSIDAGLIMMPTRGCGPYRRTVLGSVTAKVLHDCDCPVWTSVHIENALPTDPFCRRIACAIDLGPHTNKVMNWASSFASRIGAHLLVVHATAPADPFIQDASEPEPGVIDVETARGNIERMLRRMNVSAEVVVESGPFTEVLYRRVAEFGSDLLIIGRHAATGIASRLHPHAYSIIRESPCPVVSI